MVIVGVASIAQARPKPKKCIWDKKNPILDSVETRRVLWMARSDNGPVSLIWDGTANAVVLVHTLDGTAIGTPVKLPVKLDDARVLGFERTSTGYIGVVGKANRTGLSKAETPKDSMRFVVQLDGTSGTAIELPARFSNRTVGATVVGTSVVVQTDTSIDTLDAKLAPISGATGTNLRSVAMLGSDLLAVVDGGDANAALHLRIYDPEAGAWKGSPIKLTDIPNAVVAPLGDGALVIALASGKKDTAVIEAAMVHPDGTLDRWQVWQSWPSGYTMDPSALVVERAPGGDTFIQWSRQLSSGMGRDDTPKYFAAQIQPDGKLGPISAPTTDSVQVGGSVATDDALYIAPASPDPMASLMRWSCK